MLKLCKTQKAGLRLPWKLVLISCEEIAQQVITNKVSLTFRQWWRLPIEATLSRTVRGFCCYYLISFTVILSVDQISGFPQAFMSVPCISSFRRNKDMVYC